ncbi:MAG: hypothetical protein A3D31_04705 [Candidatus Fluviicola riflensis]|nr:MAG: hypothetical protein CHH17_10315 [Candidatus Fluviicola riflensis]OGS79276.1 MAG: hypothetical protein A3D31_04705 [Candidatus Fluviicola riflensis]OGS86708.1 MAG: hypothetical protein A2724_04165 [Fluviicola sp. RIFCSPHIGHO2_01_FULL_43_53]OGS88818.1 MAG: hypothetical protein A3E30_00495 [Fluviicola sp. RIFCSPHIGHO2_12_FULL_43_24]
MALFCGEIVTRFSIMVTKFLYKKSYSQLPQMHRFCSANALAQHLYHRIDYTELTLNKEPTSAAVRSAKI